MKIMLILVLLQLSGCGIMAHMYNQSDACQAYNKGPGYQRPNWCGSGTGNTQYVRDFQSGRVVGTIQPNIYGSPYYSIKPY